MVLISPVVNPVLLYVKLLLSALVMVGCPFLE